MSFFKVAAPPPTAPTASHADFTIHSDSDNDTPTQRENETSDSSRNLFSHSSDFLAVQSARIAQEKKRKEREERKKREKSEERRERRVKKEKKDKSKRKSGDRDEEDGRVKKEGDLKKRRISGKEGEALLRRALAGTKAADSGSSDEEDEPGNEEIITHEMLPVRRSPRRSRQDFEHGSPAAKSRPIRPVPDDDEDDLQITLTTSIRRPSPPPEDEDSDPEIAALTRNARAAAAQRKLAAATKPPQDQRTSTPTTSELPTASSTSTPTSDHADPIISILVSSPMSEGVILIRRRISQTLGAVREAYCKRWHLPDHCFLTFCGRRLWDSTTCRRFGLVIDAEGNASWGDKDPHHAAGMGKAGAEVEQQEPGQVHVEVMDEAWFKQIQEEKERERKERMGELPEGDDEQETAGQEEKQEEYIKLMVKAKGKRDLRLKVTPTTLFQKIIMASKRSFQLPDDADVRLEFDGDRLDPKAMVRSTEISDMDCLDLYVGK
ncbi:hypothetical protein TI39_contig1089g00008 [Zymoseptoria brevis]|uniref:Rad60/SUMO-like domain-containing protein n=1 Tax=Zymoseptoria brevis TaxID=1047168 RepID=A0A0F4GE85_9PEZI|nr:hypothetical protein TI39_contig1089g00008 [Zymoseptoria brevis]